jgi:SAM-dependent methyltransferase
MFRATAHIYDLIYAAEGKDYRTEADTIHEQISERLPTAASLLDVACGTGGHLRHLIRWYDVVGLDVDPGMLAEARKVLVDVPLVEADMRSFNLGRTFDAVICLFSSIGYMATSTELTSAVRAMASHLGIGGVLIVDGWVRSDAWIAPGTVHSVAAVADNVAVARAGRSWRDGVTCILELHHLVATRDGVEHLIDEHRLTLFTEADYESAFRAAGLVVERVASPMPGRDRYIGVRH